MFVVDLKQQQAWKTQATHTSAWTTAARKKAAQGWKRSV